ncbi:MAG: efflux RND transporter periplasmic adaptor subunit [Rhodanobacteraceae bacterium]|nr:MAG: efflux RND transporter periplasmic adaptor subunit [Rhodanobacteraceae bacterium]
MSRTKWILTVIGIVIVALILWRIFSGHGKAQGPGDFGANAPVPVTVVPAADQNVPVYVTGTGTVTPINSVNVQPQVGGTLLKLDFVEGKPVTAGQLLAQIDPRTLQAQLDQAIGKRNQDQTQLATAVANLERSENPKYAPYVAQIDKITQANTVAQYKAAVAADNAAIDSTKVQLGFTRITSPIDGVVGIRQVTPGNVVTTSTTIVTVVQMHPIDVLFTLPGKYLDEVRNAQQKAPLKVAILDANGNVVEADGTLKVIGNQIDADTNTFQLKAEFPNANNQLFPGQYANTRVEVSIDSNALVVPTAAVQRGPNGDYVWLITDKPPPGSSASPDSSDKTGRGRRSARKDAPNSSAADNKPAKYVTMQAVTTGGEAGDTGLIVTKGLKTGDLVVTAGQFRLKQGSKVTPMKPGEIPPPPTTAQIKAAMSSGGRGGRH